MLDGLNTLAVAAVLRVAPAVLAAPENKPNTDDLAAWLRAFFGPLLLVIVGIVAIFFLFTREITRFVQFIVLAIIVSVIFYWPGVLTSIAEGIATALGVDTGTTDPSPSESPTKTP